MRFEGHVKSRSEVCGNLTLERLDRRNNVNEGMKAGKFRPCSRNRIWSLLPSVGMCRDEQRGVT